MLKHRKCIGSGFCSLGPSRCAHKLRKFWRKLQELGYSEGKNLIFEIREAHGDVDRLPKLASEIVDTHPDVIVAVTSPASAAAKMATQTIPIVMAIVPDPIGLGLVASLPRPGTNITGSSSLAIETIPKRVQLIKEMLPELSILGMLWNAKAASNRLMFQSAEQAARSLGVPLRSFPVQGTDKMQFPIHPHMLRHGCGYALANAGHDTRALQAWLGHKNIQHTVRYTELAPDRFKDFWGKA
jgi:ABC-type uncharacterized transport system substrate-binding protein